MLNTENPWLNLILIQLSFQLVIIIYLNGVWVTGLTEDLKQGGIRHEEEPREDETFLLQVPCQRFLADLQLFQKVGQKLDHRVITHTAVHHVWLLVSSLHDLHPGFVNVAEALCFLWRDTISQFSVCARFWNKSVIVLNRTFFNFPALKLANTLIIGLHQANKVLIG